MVHELEARVKQLSVEVENGNLLRQKVTQEKAELEIHIASISAELQEANRRYEKSWQAQIRLIAGAEIWCNRCKPWWTHLTWRVFQTVGRVTSVLNPLSSVKFYVLERVKSLVIVCVLQDCVPAEGDGADERPAWRHAAETSGQT